MQVLYSHLKPTNQIVHLFVHWLSNIRKSEYEIVQKVWKESKYPSLKKQLVFAHHWIERLRLRYKFPGGNPFSVDLLLANPLDEASWNKKDQPDRKTLWRKNLCICNVYLSKL